MKVVNVLSSLFSVVFFTFFSLSYNTNYLEMLTAFPLYREGCTRLVFSQCPQNIDINKI